MALSLVVLTVGLAVLVWTWRTHPRKRRSVVGVIAAGGLGLQSVHALDHVAQVVAWVAAPDNPPFLTPWAVVGRDALAVGGDAALGNELLHLSGNLVFLAGLLALGWLARPARSWSRSLRFALILQGAHVAEHVALTVTAAWMGTAIGLTTLFGTLDAGPRLWALRVIAHFMLNAVATVAAGLAVRARYGFGRHGFHHRGLATPVENPLRVPR
jgi:hypothetical protein